MVEKRARMNAQKYEQYLRDGCMNGMEPHYEGCSENWAKDYELTAASWHDLKNNVAIEYVQSWNTDESKRMGAKALMEIGVDTAKELYPGHQFAVVPHVNKGGNYHNHIMICTVSSETGKRITSDFTERSRFNQATDKRCLALGLSTPDRAKSKVKERLSKDAHQMMAKRNATPIDLQIMKAADGARTLATDMDGFVRSMLSLGFGVDDRGKVLTFFHPDREKGVRDRRLGTNYTKEGLNERFDNNRKVFSERPELRGILEAQLRNLYDGKGHLVGDASQFPFAPGGHQQFENRARPGEKDVLKNPEDHTSRASDLSSIGGFLARHVDGTRSLSIIDYCNKERIPLNRNDDGTYRLRGRENILIRGTTWENTKEKNGKRIGGQGGLLEFVGNHMGVSPLGALAKITGNDLFAQLETHFGLGGSSYKEFHVPKIRPAPEKTALEHLEIFAKVLGKKSAWNKALLNSKRVQVTTEGIIRFVFGKDEGAIDHKRNKDGKWVKSVLGNIQGGLISQEGKGSSVSVFRDPFSFMEATNGRGKMVFSGGDSLLVLGDEKDNSLDFFLAANPHVKKVQFVGFGANEKDVSRHRLLSQNDIKFEFMQIGGASRGKAKGIDFEIKI